MLKFNFLTLILVAMFFIPSLGLAQVAPEETKLGLLHKVQAVTLYPSSAKVEVKGKANPEKLPSGEVVLVAYLPGSSDPNTLSANIDGKLTGMNIEQLTKDDNSDPILAPWKEALLTAEAEYGLIAAKQHAAESSHAMWSKPGMPKANIASELNKLDSAMQNGLEAATEELLKLTPLLEQATQKLGLAKINLSKLSPSFKVSFVLAELLPGSDFSYSYMLNQCGWQPSYTLNALPKEGQVELGFSAQVTQASGFDWKGIKVSLATNAPSWNIAPPNLARWYIGQAAPPQISPSMAPRAKRVAVSADMEMFGSPDAGLSRVSYAPPQAPQESVFATFSIWDMGQRTLVHDNTAVFSVMDEGLESNFLYIARPNISRQAFLTATLKPTSDKRILPRAKAVFLVEGNTVGNGYYPPEEGEGIYFGTDPLITVFSKELTNQSDERGLISKTQVHNWAWKYEVENLSKKEIALQVEDSIPSLTDSRMEIKISSIPKPKVNKLKSIYIWNTTLRPQGKFEIEQKIEATSPADVGLVSTR